MKEAMIVCAVLVWGTVALADRGRPHMSGGTVRADNGQLLRTSDLCVMQWCPWIWENESWYTCLRDKQNFNTVRAGVFIGRWCDDPDGEYATVPIVLSQLDVVVDIAARLNMYVIIDNHSSCCGRYDYARNAEFWSAVAPRYRDRTHVLYEIQNEPTGGNNYWDELIQFEKDMFHLIRGHAPQTPVITMSFMNWGGPGMKATTDKSASGADAIDYSNAAVGFHFYGGGDYADILKLKDAYPCIMTETAPDESIGMTVEILENQIKWLDQNGISWSFMDTYGIKGQGDGEGKLGIPVTWQADPGCTGAVATGIADHARSPFCRIISNSWTSMMLLSSNEGSKMYDLTGNRMRMNQPHGNGCYIIIADGQATSTAIMQR
jgi:hypothetical protein